MMAGVNKDYPPTDEEGFMAFARSLDPLFYAALESAEPLSPPFGYRRTENRWRHYEALAQWPEGFVVVGDAFSAFNPIYGQGMTVSAMTAIALDEALQRAGGKLRGLAPRFQKQVARVTRPGGRRLSAAVPRHPLGNFFWLAIALSWGYWVPPRRRRR